MKKGSKMFKAILFIVLLVLVSSLCWLIILRVKYLLEIQKDLFKLKEQILYFLIEQKLLVVIVVVISICCILFNILEETRLINVIRYYPLIMIFKKFINLNAGQWQTIQNLFSNEIDGFQNIHGQNVPQMMFKEMWIKNEQIITP